MSRHNSLGSGESPGSMIPGPNTCRSIPARRHVGQADHAAALEQLLRKDATLEAPPLRIWYAGIKFCMPYMATHVLGSPGHWRMLPTSANGQPAVAAYYRGSDGTYLPYGIVVLTVTAEGISRITAFGDPELVTAFGFPAVPPAVDAG
jgi:RNA polymerase sigma-70 factor (ECF subfamily)